jgi:hypothetical protein
MQPGQILVNANGEKRKILFVSGDLIIPSKIGNFDMASSNFTKKELEKFGWSLLEEPWVPKKGEDYWKVDSDGDVYYRKNHDSESDHFHFKIGNCGRTKADAELYKQKLIERMGRKEN